MFETGGYPVALTNQKPTDLSNRPLRGNPPLLVQRFKVNVIRCLPGAPRPGPTRSSSRLDDGRESGRAHPKRILRSCAPSSPQRLAPAITRTSNGSLGSTLYVSFRNLPPPPNPETNRCRRPAPSGRTLPARAFPRARRYPLSNPRDRPAPSREDHGTHVARYGLRAPIPGDLVR